MEIEMRVRQRKQNRERSVQDMIKRTRDIVGTKADRNRNEYELALKDIERKQQILKQG